LVKPKRYLFLVDPDFAPAQRALAALKAVSQGERMKFLRALVFIGLQAKLKDQTAAQAALRLTNEPSKN
jgi:hypothetical protein